MTGALPFKWFREITSSCLRRAVSEDPQDALERIFTPEALDEVMRVAEQCSDRSVISEALRFVLEQTLPHDLDTPSATALFHHYGIQTGGQRGFGRRLRNLVLFMFRPVAPSTVDHLQNIESLARVYCEANPDGGVGYSFGALLGRYLFFNHIYFPQHVTGVEACLIGRDKVHIVGGDHETVQESVGRSDGALDASVTMHWVRGGYLAHPGPARVTKGLLDLLDGLDPNLLYLCHGTTIARASAILSQGPNLLEATLSTEFGQAFYLTDSFEYAVNSGYQVSAGRCDAAVLVFPVHPADLVEDKTLRLADGDAWQQVVRGGRTGKSIKIATVQAEYEKADCVIGPISSNASKVDTDTGKQQARASRFQQWAFKGQPFTRHLEKYQ
jgi:hypothetical protein